MKIFLKIFTIVCLGVGSVGFGFGGGLFANEALLLRTGNSLTLVNEKGLRTIDVPQEFLQSKTSNTIWYNPLGHLVFLYGATNEQNIISWNLSNNAISRQKHLADTGVAILRNLAAYLPARNSYLFTEVYQNGDGSLVELQNNKQNKIKFAELNKDRYFLDVVGNDGRFCFRYNPHWTMAKDDKFSSDFFVGMLTTDKQSLHCAQLGSNKVEKIFEAGCFYRVEFVNDGSHLVFLTEGVVDEKNNRRSHFIYRYEFAGKKLKKIGEIFSIISDGKTRFLGAPYLHVYQHSPYIVYARSPESNYVMSKQWSLINVLTEEKKDFEVSKDENFVEMFPVSYEKIGSASGIHTLKPYFITSQWLAYDSTKRHVSLKFKIRTLPDLKEYKTFDYIGPTFYNAVMVDEKVFSNLAKYNKVSSVKPVVLELAEPKKILAKKGFTMKDGHDILFQDGDKYFAAKIEKVSSAGVAIIEYRNNQKSQKGFQQFNGFWQKGDPISCAKSANVFSGEFDRLLNERIVIKTKDNQHLTFTPGECYSFAK